MDTLTPLDRLAELLSRKQAVVLTGAGISTESGIPDYRGPESAKKPRHPMQFREFASSAKARSRYWARSTLGWPQMASRAPNAGHIALARMEASGIVAGIITQNVDSLHQKAGASRVIELHGALRQVVCMDCGSMDDRDSFQERLLDMNDGWDRMFARMAPDGDVDLPESISERFNVPGCRKCGGTIKPNVVFFGENVPAERVAAAWELLSRGEVLLVLGSSLTVFSGYRFVDRSVRDGRPVVIINNGPTRGDGVADIRLEARLGEALPQLQRMVGRD